MDETAEIRKVNRLIRQFESVYKSTSDAHQRKRVLTELKDLRDYRDKFSALHGVADADLEVPEVQELPAGFPILTDLLGEEEDPPELSDEVGVLRLYMDCFYDEFMIFLTPKKLRLDAKYSLARDKFYAEYHEIERDRQDYLKAAASGGEMIRSSHYTTDVTTDIKSRTYKLKTNLLIKAARYFTKVRDFADEILEDLDAEGAICKNGDDVLMFNELPGIKYLGGLQVWYALKLLASFAREVLQFLNVPSASI